MTAPVTLALVRDALASIPAAMARGEWAKVGMAIKSEFPDEEGFALFDQWSATADGYKATDVRSTWQSIKAGGGVGIGTLFRLAKENGFSMQTFAPLPVSAATVADDARRAGERAQRIATDDAQRSTKQAAAALQAVALWDAATEGPHAYLTRKGVRAYGVRVSASGALLIPLRDDTGQLCNVQTIVAIKAADGPDKLFLSGGRKSGLWHELGMLAGADVVLIAEGYATAASVHEATGHAAVVAFDAGNLAHVAKALRKLYPAVLLVLCGDDDKATHATTGTNPGRDKATAAAKAVRGVTAFPEALPDGASDFNDLHQVSGLDAVRVLIEAAIGAHRVRGEQGQPRQQNMNQNTTAQPRSTTDNASDRTQEDNGITPPVDRFRIGDDGVWYMPPGEDARPVRVCGPLRVVGLARDMQDNQAALLLEFDSALCAARRWLMPMAMLAGDGTAYRSALLSQGFVTPQDSKRRGLMTEYLQSRQNLELVRHVPKVGWHGRSYVLPGETLGTNPDGERVVFHSEAGVEANFSQRGDLADWQAQLARLCVGNTRLAFVVSLAFAGPLLAWASGTTGGLFHFVGATSIGKTTGFLIAASVWGKGTEKDPKSYMQKWRATSNGLETQAEQHNDCTLILDELGQMDANDAGNAVYMLADGVGKTRMKSGGGARPKATWRCLGASSGELSLVQHMESVGKKMKGGQEVRMIPIPAEVTPGSALETCHQFDNGHALSSHVQHFGARSYGTAGRAWLEHLVGNIDGLGAKLRERMDTIEALIVPAGAAGQVKRGGRRFALVAAAGELATEAGLTGWPEGEATRAAQACFNSWIVARGGSGSSEATAGLRQIKNFIEQEAEGRFTDWWRKDDDHAPHTLKRVGYRRPVDTDGKPLSKNNTQLPGVTAARGSEEYLIFVESFRSEVCKGLDAALMSRLLLQHGCLIPEWKPAPNADEVRRFDTSHRPHGGGLVRMYRITPKILELDL